MFRRSDSRSTMSISCSCSLRERQILPQNLDRARHRRQRIANLVRDAGGHFADRRQTLLHGRVAFQLLDVGHVLEREQIAGAAARRLEVRRAQADLDIGALSARRYLNS